MDEEGKLTGAPNIPEFSQNKVYKNDVHMTFTLHWLSQHQVTYNTFEKLWNFTDEISIKPILFFHRIHYY